MTRRTAAVAWLIVGVAVTAGCTGESVGGPASTAPPTSVVDAGAAVRDSPAAQPTTTSTGPLATPSSGTVATVPPSPAPPSTPISWQPSSLPAGYLEVPGLSRTSAFLTVGDVLVLYVEGEQGAAIWTRIGEDWSEPVAVPGLPREDPGVVGTDAELILWGGVRVVDGVIVPLDDGLAFAPASNTWRVISPGPLTARRAPTLVWTGTHVVVAGGYADGPTIEPDVGVYRPADDTWQVAPGLDVLSDTYSLIATARLGGAALWLYSERSRSQQLIFLDAALAWSTLPTPPVLHPGPLVEVGDRLVATTTVMGEEAVAVLEPGSAGWTDLAVPSVHTEVICPVALARLQHSIVWIDGCDGATFVLGATGWDRVPADGALAAGLFEVAWTPERLFVVAINASDPRFELWELRAGK